MPLNIGSESFEGIPDSYYDDHHSNRILSLRSRNLEKTVVRTCEVLTHPDTVKWFNENCLTWLKRFERDVATLVANPRKEGDEDRSYIVKNQIGNISLRWPRSYRI